MANAAQVKARYYDALNSLYPTLRKLPSTRQLVAAAGGSNTTAEKYMDMWCLENSIEPPSKEKRSLNPRVEDAIEAEVEQRTLEACTSYKEEVETLGSANLDLRENVESLREQLKIVGERLDVLGTQNQQYFGQIIQLEKEVGAAREESRLVREKAEQTVEEYRQKAQEAEEAKKKAEADLAAFPEINKRAETDLLIAQVLSKALEREAWFASHVQQQIQSETSQAKPGNASSNKTSARK